MRRFGGPPAASVPSLRDSTLFHFCFPALKCRAFIYRCFAAEASGDFRLFAVLVVATQIRPSRHQTKSKVIYNVAMRRPLTIAAFVVVLLVALVSASAQRGGMRSSGGGRGGAVGRPSGGGHGIGIGRSIGGTSGGHAFGGMHAGLGSRLSFRGDRFGGGRFHSSGFRHCFGCRRGFGYPWYSGYGYAGYYDPYGWSGSSSSDDYHEGRVLALCHGS